MLTCKSLNGGFPIRAETAYPIWYLYLGIVLQSYIENGFVYSLNTAFGFERLGFRVLNECKSRKAL